MFPSIQSDEWMYEISDIPHMEDLKQQNLTSGEASVEGISSNLTQRMGKAKRLKSLANNNDGDAADNNDRDAKKIMRKEIERQRRQQMAKLYEKLRLLLPLESIKVNELYLF